MLLATTHFLAQEAMGFLLVIIYFIVFTLVVIISIILVFSAFNEEIQITVKLYFAGSQSPRLLVIKKKKFSLFIHLFKFKKKGGGETYLLTYFFPVVYSSEEKFVLFYPLMHVNLLLRCME